MSKKIEVEFKLKDGEFLPVVELAGNIKNDEIFVEVAIIKDENNLLQIDNDIAVKLIEYLVSKVDENVIYINEGTFLFKKSKSILEILTEKRKTSELVEELRKFWDQNNS